MVDFISKDRYDFQDLVRLVHVLRAPGGCPWDGAQTHLSIRRNFLEEAYEACEGFDRDDPQIMCEELGVPTENIGAFKTGADAILELKSGRVDAVVIDTAPAKVFCAENDDIVIIEGLDIEPEYYGIAVKKGNQELLDAINATIARLKEDGTYDELLVAFFAE